MKKNSLKLILILILVIVGIIMIISKEKKNNIDSYEKYDCKAEYELTSSTNHKYKNTWNYKFEIENDIDNNTSIVKFGELNLIYEFNDIEGYKEHKQSNFHIDGVEDIPENDDKNLTKTYKYIYKIKIPNKENEELSLKEYIDYLSTRDYKCIKTEGF